MTTNGSRYIEKQLAKWREIKRAYPKYAEQCPFDKSTITERCMRIGQEARTFAVQPHEYVRIATATLQEDYIRDLQAAL